MNTARSKTLKVLEIYPAFQGEGTRIGVPSVFVRLAGCTVGCSWCDTKFSWRQDQGDEMSIHEILDRVGGFGWRSIVLTGGEPLEQPLDEVATLLRHAVGDGYHVTVETSGHVDANELDWMMGQLIPGTNILWSVSPKLGSASLAPGVKFVRPFIWQRLCRQEKHDLQFKYVVADFVDFEDAVGFMTEDDIRGPASLILQPMTPTAKIDTMRAEIISRLETLNAWAMGSGDITNLINNGVNVRVLCQLHALVYGAKRGV